MFVKLACGAAMVACLAASSCASAVHAVRTQTPAAGAAWVELGTQSGPIPSPTRSQPAHLLIWREQSILIDVGDGAAEQLAKAGISLGDVRAIFISHLHFDHTGGLFGFLGARFQASGPAPQPLSIYGPPGTRILVEGLRSAMQAGGALGPAPVPVYDVIELNDASSVMLGDVRITAAANSHYNAWPEASARPTSLSYRFDTPGRSIVYTGDTGPSANVERLARGADLLVSEIMDTETALGAIQRQNPDTPPPVLAFLRAHFNHDHLASEQVGVLARNAGVRAVVLTHFGGDARDAAQIARLKREIGRHYDGPVTFANDLDRF